MKNVKMLLMAAFTILAVSVFAQKDKKQEKKHTDKTEYACPMKCEGDKTYAKAGKCPKCKMDLKEKKEHASTFACPMKCEGGKTYTEAGKCPKCKMNLKENKEHAVAYACPMKCEGEKTYDKEGKCPKCGMAIKEKKEAKKDEHEGHNH